MSVHVHDLSCREMAERISDYLDGDLRRDLRTVIDAHRGDCPPCEAFIRTLERTVDLVRALPRDAALSPSSKRKLARALQEAAPRPGRKRV